MNEKAMQEILAKVEAAIKRNGQKLEARQAYCKKYIKIWEGHLAVATSKKRIAECKKRIAANKALAVKTIDDEFAEYDAMEDAAGGQDEFDALAKYLDI